MPVYFPRMNIFILRHGIALERDDWKGKDDSLRPLTREGEKQLQKISSALKKMKLEFDLILSSPYARAKTTAEIVADKLKLKKRLKLSEALIAGGDPGQVVNEIASTQDAAGIPVARRARALSKPVNFATHLRGRRYEH